MFIGNSEYKLCRCAWFLSFSIDSCSNEWNKWGALSAFSPENKLLLFITRTDIADLINTTIVLTWLLHAKSICSVNFQKFLNYGRHNKSPLRSMESAAYDAWHYLKWSWRISPVYTTIQPVTRSNSVWTHTNKYSLHVWAIRNGIFRCYKLPFCQWAACFSSQNPEVA